MGLRFKKNEAVFVLVEFVVQSKIIFRVVLLESSLEEMGYAAILPRNKGTSSHPACPSHIFDVGRHNVRFHTHSVDISRV